MHDKILNYTLHAFDTQDTEVLCGYSDKLHLVVRYCDVGFVYVIMLILMCNYTDFAMSRY